MTKKKTWLLAEYWATQETLEVAQAAFSECDLIGLETDDGHKPEGESAYPEGAILIKAYFAPDQDKALVTDSLARFFAACGFVPQLIHFSLMEDGDWQANFVRSCTTFKVEPDIYIVPSFEIDAFKKDPKGDLYIEMDPENAFGTGQHQTTQLCLKLIHEALCKSPKTPSFTCLDVGTGSGILAILMKKLLAHSVLATETDEEALITAQKNALKNHVEMDFLVVSETHHYDKNHYDLVVANILAPVLIDMAKNLFGALKPKGLLILSGILITQAQSVIDAYQHLGAELIKQETINDWCALALQA